MSDQDETAAPTESYQNEIIARSDLTSFIEMFDTHAAYVFDYCNGLLGDQEEAASATESILIAAQSILQDREKMRTWLFALARRECMTVSPERADGDEAVSGSPEEELPTPSALPQLQREALNLVYRLGILPDDLATVLGVPHEEAEALLESAEAGFGHAADAAPGIAVIRAEEAKNFGREERAGLPLAALPPSVWQGTTAALFGFELPSRADSSRTARKRPAGSQPGPSANGRNRLKIVAAALIPLTAGVAGFLYLTHPSGDAGPPRGAPASATPPVDAANSSGATAASSHNTAERGPARHSSTGSPAQPAPGTDAFSSTSKPKPSTSATPTLSPGSPSPSTPPSSPSPSSPSPSPSPSSPAPSSPPPSPSSSPTPSGT